MIKDLMYIELKTGYSDDGPAWIGYVKTSKTKKTIYFNDHAFQKYNGGYSNYVDIENGDEYWISGLKKRESNRHWAGHGKIMIDRRAVNEYLSLIGEKELPLNLFEVVDIEDRFPVKRVKELLEQVGLAKSVNKKMKKLSGGMKRRAGIAQAMLNNPKILILDEPTAGLDPTERVRFRNLISELSEERIVILSTHIVSDVEYIANEIWLMKEGQIVQQGDLDHMLASMQENVYACEVSQAEATKMMKQFKVSNMKAERGMVELRIIADQPPIHGASVVEPTLEDVFLYYFGEKGGEME